MNRYINIIPKLVKNSNNKSINILVNHSTFNNVKRSNHLNSQVQIQLFSNSFSNSSSIYSIRHYPSSNIINSNKINEIKIDSNSSKEEIYNHLEKEITKIEFDYIDDKSQKSKLESLLQICNKLVEQDSSSYDALLFKSMVLAHLERFYDSLEVSKMAMELTDTNPKYGMRTKYDAIAVYGISLINVNRDREAFELLTRYYEKELDNIKQSPDLLRVMYRVFSLSAEHKDKCYSLLKLLESCKNNKWHPTDSMSLGIIEYFEGDKNTAIKYIDKGLATFIPSKHPKDTVEFSIYAFALKIKSQILPSESKEKIEILKKMLEIDPEFNDAYELAKAARHEFPQDSYKYSSIAIELLNNQEVAINSNDKLVFYYIDVRLIKLYSMSHIDNQSFNIQEIRELQSELLQYIDHSMFNSKMKCNFYLALSLVLMKNTKYNQQQYNDFVNSLSVADRIDLNHHMEKDYSKSDLLNGIQKWKHQLNNYLSNNKDRSSNYLNQAKEIIESIESMLSYDYDSAAGGISTVIQFYNQFLVLVSPKPFRVIINYDFLNLRQIIKRKWVVSKLPRNGDQLCSNMVNNTTWDNTDFNAGIEHAMNLIKSLNPFGIALFCYLKAPSSKKDHVTRANIFRDYIPVESSDKFRNMDKQEQLAYLTIKEHTLWLTADNSHEYINNINKLITKEPDFIPAQLFYVKSLLKLGHIEESTRILENIVYHSTNSAYPNAVVTALNYLGFIDIHCGNPDAALDKYNRIYQLGLSDKNSGSTQNYDTLRGILQADCLKANQQLIQKLKDDKDLERSVQLKIYQTCCIANAILSRDSLLEKDLDMVYSMGGVSESEYLISLIQNRADPPKDILNVFYTNLCEIFEKDKDKLNYYKNRINENLFN